MTGPDDVIPLRAMADKARALARGTGRLTIDILVNYAEACDQQVAEHGAAAGKPADEPR